MDIFREYKDIFGKSKQGLHSYRLLDVAIVDYMMTIIGAIILSYYTEIPLVVTTIGLFVLGILLHLLFGVSTGTMRWLGL